ncbi:hypothetical protein MCOR27_003858 [Pyricularia oryzae]|nr:hypothetical protein MCOR26_009187 [Pyricularia oryzae]KAI6282269.1 hypothetical protein MCOR27_003858 [Pyricularia oryzae]KAI6317821.1 hypothetical protein MCOR29_006174 [Pyricularia oryzae]KAI6387274.1 hypothetical protein MCOR23_011143 [Pyricularia oryzae]KAI6438714.1 hypothetical protein MCOR22_008583 [Pyricularia oryzae]
MAARCTVECQTRWEVRRPLAVRGCILAKSSDWPVNQRGYGRTAGGQAASCHGSVIWVVARRRPSEGAAFCGIGNPVEATRAGILL